MPQTLRETLFEAEAVRRILAETRCDNDERTELLALRRRLLKRARTARLLGW